MKLVQNQINVQLKLHIYVQLINNVLEIQLNVYQRNKDVTKTKLLVQINHALQNIANVA
jgi:hypothetical protein